MRTLIELIALGSTREEDISTDVQAVVKPIGRDEFAAAGAVGMKARHMFEVWQDEYQEEEELVYGNKRLVIYRTYGPREDRKIELYAGERIGAR